MCVLVAGWQVAVFSAILRKTPDRYSICPCDAVLFTISHLHNNRNCINNTTKHAGYRNNCFESARAARRRGDHQIPQQRTTPIACPAVRQQTHHGLIHLQPAATGRTSRSSATFAGQQVSLCRRRDITLQLRSQFTLFAPQKTSCRSAGQRRSHSGVARSHFGCPAEQRRCPSGFGAVLGAEHC